MQRSISRSLTLATAILAAGCGDLSHTNPFDPKTPDTGQAKASLSGTVTLETVGGSAPALSGTSVSVVGSKATRTAFTDSSGAWTATEVPPGSYAVRATRTGYREGFVSGVTVTIDDGGSALQVPALQLVLGRVQVSGRVALLLPDSTEEQTGGAAVSLQELSESALTGSDGTFSFSSVPAGSYTLEASKVGYLSKTAAVVVTDAGNFDVPPVSLDTNPGWLSGTVQVVGGAVGPSEALVRARGTTLGGTPWEGSAHPLPSDGSYLVSDLPAGTYSVTYELTDYGTVATAAAVAPGKETAMPPVALVRETGSVIGVAQLEGTGDHSGIQVSLTTWPKTAGSQPLAAALTDTGGNWRMDLLPVGIYAIDYVKTPGYAPGTGTVTVPAKATVTATPALLAAIPGVVRGRAFFEGGSAGGWTGTAVRIEGTTLATVTVADGSWSITGVGAGAHTVVFERTGFDAQRAQVATAPGGDMTLTDVTLAVSRGAVTGTALATGAADASGTVVVATGPETATAVTDGSGAFQLGGLRVGAYTVTARRAGYATATASATVTANGTASAGTLTLTLDTTGSIAGTAAVARPAGANGAIAVSLTGTDLNGATVTRSTSTASNGTWSVTALPQGTYSLVFTKTPYDAQSLSGLSLLAGRAVTAPPVTLPVADGAVSGNVALDVSTVPGFAAIADRSGTVVTLVDGAAQVASAVTDASGNFLFPSAPALPVSGATYTATAQRASFTTGTLPVTPLPNATVGNQNLSIQLRAGSVAGAVVLWDNVGNAGANGSHAGATVSLSGTAFNGVAWTPAAAVTGATGAWSFASLPPGTYAVVVTSTGRACPAYASQVVQPGAATAAGSVQCRDTVAPGVVGLGAPTPTGVGLSGWVGGTSVTIPVVTQATDATGPPNNLRGYQAVLGAAPSWGAASLTAAPAASLTVGGLATNATNTIWVRALDWADNTGPAVSVQVVQDGALPTAPIVSTPSAWVSDVSTSVTLTGSDTDANFMRYEACWASVAATATCASSPAGICTPTPVAQTFPLPLTADQRTCIWARAADKAGNLSGSTMAWVVSDLTLPTPPTFAPSFDPTQITFHAEYVDFFVSQAATDGPAGGAAWQNVAYLEVNSGSGLTPLCPAAACHPSNAYNPCAAGCNCGDPRLRCSGTTFLGVRMPLLGGVLNEFQARAVDLAGNRGTAVVQQVDTSGSVAPVQVTTGQDNAPRVLGGLLAVADQLYELGPNQRLDSIDTRCTVPVVANYNSARAMLEPARSDLVVYGRSLSPNSTVTMRRAGASGLCASYTDTVIRTTGAWYLASVTASGERAAWSEGSSIWGSLTAYVQEPGSDGRLGGPSSPAPTNMGTFSSLTDIQLRGGSLLVYGDPGTGKRWRVWTAPTGAITPASTSYTFPADVYAAGLSSDGKLLATFSSTGVLTIRRPNASGVYDGVTDPFVSHTFSGTIGAASVAVEGSHAVAFDGSVPSYIYSWYAGGDGVFNTFDDVHAKMLPQSSVRYQPALGTGLAEGLLYHQVGVTNSGDEVDTFSLDLAAFRWDSPPVFSIDSEVFTNRAGTQFFAPASGGLVNRTSDGRQASISGVSFPGAADGNDLLLTAPGGTVQHFGPDATGVWFTATAQPAVTLYSGATGSQVAVGSGKAMVRGASNSVQVLQPVAGSFRNGATAVRIDTTPASTTTVPNTYGTAITGPHAFYTCTENGTNALRLCYRYAGTDGVYGAGPAETTTILGHLGGTAYYGVQGIKAHGGQVFVSASYGGNSLVLEPGPDGIFGTADDVVHSFGLISPIDRRWQLAGRYFTWISPVAGLGPQVFVADLASGAQRQVTSHYSDKAYLNVDVTGRLSWIDAAFATPMVFVSSP